MILRVSFWADSREPVDADTYDSQSLSFIRFCIPTYFLHITHFINEDKQSAVVKIHAALVVFAYRQNVNTAQVILAHIVNTRNTKQLTCIFLEGTSGFLNEFWKQSFFLWSGNTEIVPALSSSNSKIREKVIIWHSGSWKGAGSGKEQVMMKWKSHHRLFSIQFRYMRNKILCSQAMLDGISAYHPRYILTDK